MSSELSVYLLEDDPLLASHVLEVLGRERGVLCVGHADSLSAARAELPVLRPQVLLSDLGLPDGEAPELIRELVDQAGDWRPHILVFSVFGDESRVLQAIGAGADGYFLKGGTDRELVRVVQEAARGESPISPAIARHLMRYFDTAPSGQPTLAEAERQVLRLVVQGYVTAEIAERLACTPHQVAACVREIYHKLQQHHRGAALVSSAD